MQQNGLGGPKPPRSNRAGGSLGSGGCCPPLHSPTLGVLWDRGMSCKQPPSMGRVPPGQPTKLWGSLQHLVTGGSGRPYEVPWGLVGTPRCHATPPPPPTLPSHANPPGPSPKPPCQPTASQLSAPPAPPKDLPKDSGDGAGTQQEGEQFPPTPASGPTGDSTTVGH